jgi:hypothetical protein
MHHPDHIPMAQQWYKDKMPIKEIAAWFQVPVSTVYRWVKPRKNKKEPDLYLKFPPEELRAEYTWYQHSKGNYNAICHNNKIVLHFQPHFYQKERELFKNPEIKRELYDNRQKYLGKAQDSLSSREILRGFKISGIHIGYSHFSPLWFKAFIEEFQPTGVYDPCGGWGHRLLGVVGKNIPYIYNDIWDQSVYGIRQMVEYFNIPNIIIHQDPAEELIPTEPYDTIFTCPPYFNTEIYGSTPFENLEEWGQWWEKVLTNALHSKVKIVGIVINIQYADILEQYTLKTGLKLLRIQPVGSETLKSHLVDEKKSRCLLYIFER